MVRKREDTAEGCRAMALDDRARAADIGSSHMRSTFERSADAWTTRAELLERLQTSFTAKGEEQQLEQLQRLERKDDGEGTDALDQRGSKTEGERTQESDCGEH